VVASFVHSVLPTQRTRNESKAQRRIGLQVEFSAVRYRQPGTADSTQSRNVARSIPTASAVFSVSTRGMAGERGTASVLRQLPENARDLFNGAKHQLRSDGELRSSDRESNSAIA
jgi:hypothetical protein